MHANRSGGVLAFDGALYGGAGGTCLDPTQGSLSAFACGDGPVSDGGKVIAFNGEGDAQWFGYGERGQTADYRLMEIAGTSSCPELSPCVRGRAGAKPRRLSARGSGVPPQPHRLDRWDAAA